MTGNAVVITTCNLGGGVLATISDHTSHYFGGYYHVRILITADVPVSVTAFACQVEFEDALRILGTSVCFSRTLEKMAVPEGKVDEVRRHLLESFDNTMLPYLQRDGFCSRFLMSEYRKRLKSGHKLSHG
jgi:hypothetical protein